MSDENKETTTQQVPNPTGKGGFGDHPENRNPGGWKPEFTFSYQYRRFLNMSKEEFDTWIENNPKRTMVEDAAYYAVKDAKTSLGNRVEITDRTEGKAPQIISVDGGFFKADKLKLEVVDGDSNS